MKKHLTIFFILSVMLHEICDMTWWSLGRYTEVHWYFVTIGILIVSSILTLTVERILHKIK